MTTTNTIETTIENTSIRFIPTDDDQFPYRVIIGRTAKGWLGWQYAPGKKAAKYFYSKVVLGVDDESLLELATKKEKKPLTWTQEAFKKWLNDHLFESVGVTGYLLNTPLENYIQECRESGKWEAHPHFHQYGIGVTHARWMTRFTNYCQKYGCDTRERQGFEVLSLFNGRDEWDTIEYDTYSK
jgi:hypothetical protein